MNVTILQNRQVLNALSHSWADNSTVVFNKTRNLNTETGPVRHDGVSNFKTNRSCFCCVSLQYEFAKALAYTVYQWVASGRKQISSNVKVAISNLPRNRLCCSSAGDVSTDPVETTGLPSCVPARVLRTHVLGVDRCAKVVQQRTEDGTTVDSGRKGKSNQSSLLHVVHTFWVVIVRVRCVATEVVT